MSNDNNTLENYDAIKNVLEESEFFKGVNPGECVSIMTQLAPKLLKLENGDYLCKRGDVATQCWLIKSGQTLVSNMSLREPFKSMAYDVGRVTGLKGIALPGSLRDVSIQADGPLEVVELDSARINTLDAHIQAILWKNIAYVLGLKLRYARGVIARSA